MPRQQQQNIYVNGKHIEEQQLLLAVGTAVD
jgi:hypothetical protein